MAAATVTVLAFLLVWVVPQLAELFAGTGARLPLATRLLIGATSIVRRVVALVPVGALGGWAARRWLATDRGLVARPRALDAPLVGRIVRRAAVARVARTLATPSPAVRSTARGIAAAGSGSRSPRGDRRRARPRATRRAAGGVAARDRRLPCAVVRLAAVGERGGSLPAMLERAANAYDRDVDAAVGTATALIEPALVLVMGGVVLALVAAVLLPLLELGSLVR
jgi:type II secretory pathway component PulF